MKLTRIYNDLKTISKCQPDKTKSANVSHFWAWPIRESFDLVCFSPFSPPCPSCADEAARAAPWSLCGPPPRRVRGRHRQPVLPAEHRHHRDRQHHPERGQGAGPPQFRHGLYPDGRHYQREWSHRRVRLKRSENSLSCLQVWSVQSSYSAFCHL